MLVSWPTMAWHNATTRPPESVMGPDYNGERIADRTAGRSC
jgi:hypothetical protein